MAGRTSVYFISQLKRITIYTHGRLARWIKWKACDVGEAKEGLGNELWRRWSNGRVGEWPVTQVKLRKGWRMRWDVGEVTETLENEQSSNLPVTSPTPQLILQPFRRFTYVTAHSPTLPLPHLRHTSLYNPFFASPTSQALHLRHLASRPLTSAPTVNSFWEKMQNISTILTLMI